MIPDQPNPIQPNPNSAQPQLNSTQTQPNPNSTQLKLSPTPTQLNSNSAQTLPKLCPTPTQPQPQTPTQPKPKKYQHPATLLQAVGISGKVSGKVSDSPGTIYPKSAPGRWVFGLIRGKNSSSSTKTGLYVDESRKMGSLSTKTGLYVDESRKMGSLSTNTGKNLPIGVVLGLTRYENQAKVRLVGMI